MKRGAANIAVRGARDMTPVLIRCDPRRWARARSGGACRRAAC
jgi:hypothetical protein